MRVKKVKFTKTKNLTYLKSSCFTIKARVVFIKLRQIFIKALIFNFFYPKHYIHI